MKSANIYIDISCRYKRVALVEDGRMTEFYVESEEEHNKLVGNIYRGRVVNVLQGMQAAFVDIGRSKNAFLFVSDMPIDRRDILEGGEMPDTLSVSVGQEIICQVQKDEVGGKGARVTTNVSIPGRFVVTTPTLSFFGISRKIEDDAERSRLLEILRRSSPPGVGGIARTVSLTASKKEISDEVKAHLKVWKTVQATFSESAVGDLVYSDGDIVYRTIRDMVTEKVASVVTNDADTAEDIRKYMRTNGLGVSTKVELYDPAKDFFGDMGLSPKIDKLLQKRAELAGGGYLVIDRTEALTVIDVNSGKYVGGAYLEDTVYAVNLEAADEIARQLRLRNIGGIIIVDFIDMENSEHRQAVLARLGEALKADRTKTRIAGMTSLGLVEITRKKTSNEIGHYLLEPCETCKGSGSVLAAGAVVPQVSQRIGNAFRTTDCECVLVRVAPAIAAKLAAGALSRECETVWKDRRVYYLSDEKLLRAEIFITSFTSSIITLDDNAKLLY